MIVLLTTPALAAFQPQFIVDSSYAPTPMEHALFSTSLYVVCCSEFYNHAAEAVPYRICPQLDLPPHVHPPSRSGGERQRRSHGFVLLLIRVRERSGAAEQPSPEAGGWCGRDRADYYVA